MAKARGFFQQAISLDPANTEAMVMLAFVDACVGTLMMTDDVSGRLAAAEATLPRFGSRSARLDPTGHKTRGPSHR